jgi:hypothetical protein
MRGVFAIASVGICLCCGLLLPLSATPPQWDIGYGRIAVTNSLARVCASIRNSEDCANAIEKYQLPRSQGRFQRRGRTLEIALESGKTLSLTNSPPGAKNYKRFGYIEFLPAIGQHLIHVQYSEMQSFCLIDSKTGKESDSCGVPVLAPRGERFACDQANLEYSSSIEIWRITTQGLQREWRLDNLGWLPGAITWLTDDTIRVAKEDERGRSVGYEVFTRYRGRWLPSR